MILTEFPIILRCHLSCWCSYAKFVGVVLKLQKNLPVAEWMNRWTFSGRKGETNTLCNLLQRRRLRNIGKYCLVATDYLIYDLVFREVFLGMGVEIQVSFDFGGCVRRGKNH
jgi:hypothetical protein